uniref:DUF4160 domain-containing protein n=1 Tax=Candidatus Kentrum sp. FM TaxID=2126340 RepID=A0A450T3T8_9GAMM|nr:MAG: protein of unknown function (DUF4160) [Candidatus Kentron sp. FM]VFJ61179.1 MAG: protein of unknown function (DUF4160) [Candidatus Kentron sp. FM]VFK13601.1 MAG: protein of unknown function (DUF4160) [Candidatus Kentron sp. FM]
MPILQRFPASRILLYADDHLRPHVHVKLRDGRECTVDIDSLRTQGRVAAREIREELAWIKVISVKEHTSLLVLLPGFCVAITVT